MDGSMLFGIFAGGLSLGVAVVATYLWASLGASGGGSSAAHAQTVALATWMFGHVFLALNMRSERQPFLARGARANGAMLLWGLGAVVTLALVVAVPGLTETLRATPLTPQDWLAAFLVPLVTTSWWEVWKLVRWRGPA